jgi:hypothetical protein
VKVGDLVRDKDFIYDFNSFNHYGVIVELDEPEGMFKVIWNGQHKEWLTEMYLEVISESR